MENIKTIEEYWETIEYIRQHWPDFVAPHETVVLTLTVRDYYNFRQMFKHEYIYFGYSHERVVISAKKFLLSAYGY